MIKKYAREFEIKKENIHAHKRKIVPGDYREKLATETIAKLNAIFAENLQKYGYEIEAGLPSGTVDSMRQASCERFDLFSLYKVSCLMVTQLILL